MRKGKVLIGSWVKAEIAEAIDVEVEKGKYLKTNRSEMIESMLRVLLKNVVNDEKFSEALRREIIRNRKEGN